MLPIKERGASLWLDLALIWTKFRELESRVLLQAV